MKILVLVVGVFVSGLAQAAGFGQHLGHYAVVSAPSDLVTVAKPPGVSADCPFTDVAITREKIDGFQTLVFEAVGKHSAPEPECSALWRGALSVEGAPGIDCVETEHATQCVHGGETFRTTAQVTGHWETTLTMVSARPGQPARTLVWVLRRK